MAERFVSCFTCRGRKTKCWQDVGDKNWYCMQCWETFANEKRAEASKKKGRGQESGRKKGKEAKQGKRSLVLTSLKQAAYGYLGAKAEGLEWREDGGITVQRFVPSDTELQTAVEELGSQQQQAAAANNDSKEDQPQQHTLSSAGRVEGSRHTREVIGRLYFTEQSVSVIRHHHGHSPRQGVEFDAFEATVAKWELDTLAQLFSHYPKESAFLVMSMVKKTLVLLRTHPWKLMELVESGASVSKLRAYRLDQEKMNFGWTPSLESLRCAAAGRVKDISLDERWRAGKDLAFNAFRAQQMWIDCLAYGGNIDALVLFHKALCSDCPHGWDRPAHLTAKDLRLIRAQQDHLDNFSTDDDGGRRRVTKTDKFSIGSSYSKATPTAYGAKVLLGRCCHWNVWKVVEHILDNTFGEYHDLDVNTDLQVDLGSSFPLHCTGHRDAIDTALLLIARGVDLEAIDCTISCYESALAIAARSNSVRVMKLLIDAGADVNVGDKCWNVTPLHTAINSNSKEAVDLLLKTPGVDVDSESDMLGSIMDSVAEKNNLLLAKTLVEMGASPRILNRNGFQNETVEYLNNALLNKKGRME